MKKVVSYFTLFDKVSKTFRPLVPSENLETLLRDLKNLINENKLAFYEDMDLFHVLDLIENDGNIEIKEINKLVFSIKNLIDKKQTKTTKKD